MEKTQLQKIVREIPDIIADLFSKRNKKRIQQIGDHVISMQEGFEEIIDDGRGAAELILEMFIDIFNKEGIEIPRSRYLARLAEALSQGVTFGDRLESDPARF